MYLKNTILVYLSGVAFASPVALPQGTGVGADSCRVDALEPKTWTDLKIDDFLAGAAKNYTRTTSNNVQSLAASFGAPNFFCGLDKFCNAGQPCLPIQPPAWYAALAIQNYNNYMNSLNTAVTFASSIISLRLGEIVADVYPDPKDDITPLKNIGLMFSSVLGVIPLTGAVATTVTAINGGLGVALRRALPPTPPDRFLAWSNLGQTMSDVLSDFQRSISDSLDRSLDAVIDDPTDGINELIKGGGFLGVSQNFTQSDLQDLVTESITRHAIGLALQAQKIFVYRIAKIPSCGTLPGTMCVENGDGSFNGRLLIQADSDDNSQNKDDLAELLATKYGITQEELLKGPTDCFDMNNKQQLVNPFENGLPTDPKAPCVFNLLTCNVDAPIGKGIIERCRDQGLDI
ncbi:hypothetical protein COCMIDRAFT_641 [Bipolaris oryzae ATCC 44560]|uniref:DUF7872 domain-containing protein n=1 Tax=Bipolaris oryzae ATCC 44560 TaxID=930090 RepID=W6ZLG5_COCMI|nr:uncharacterized protein COCMIDRAFT_641 [Bipolaris oryzae ATCC 44560]EUC50793.1 hypothetical protein COCMIDRAFT_641 [Bipolaris oryzae ATCC 44560]